MISIKNKLILFDWGNIVESHLTGFSCKKAFEDLFKACGYTGDEGVYELLSKYKICEIPTIEDFEDTYNKIAEEFKFKATYLEFIKLYKDIFDNIDYYEDVAKYEKSLKDKCYIGIFSNLTVFDKERLDKQVDLSKYDYVFLSYEMGCKKPSKEIYEIINEKVPFKPEDILFIDDKQVNVDMAEKAGWKTLKAIGLELDKIKECCENFINEENK